MPRQARIDAPGALHHIICRGIERRNISKDNTDRNRFLERLDSVLQKTSTPCYGWALIPNHFHLLLKTGKEPITQIMRRLLTGYAVTFNRRHHRYGRLFQNRYKSIEPLAETSICIRNNCCIRLLCPYLELYWPLFLNFTNFCRFQRIVIPLTLLGV